MDDKSTNNVDVENLLTQTVILGMRYLPITNIGMGFQVPNPLFSTELFSALIHFKLLEVSSYL